MGLKNIFKRQKEKERTKDEIPQPEADELLVAENQNEAATEPIIANSDNSEEDKGLEELEDIITQQAEKTNEELANQKTALDQEELGVEYLEEGTEGQLAVDVYQTAGEIIIKSTIAGVRPEDLNVSINNDMLTIKGTRYQEEKVPGENYFLKECYWGSFSRTIILPVDVKQEKIEAIIKDGVLTVRLPKLGKARAKVIKIKSED